jgi:hypothetical protein
MRALLACLVLCAALTVHAQEGFPLDGTWRGQLKIGGNTTATIVIVMQWDGQKITGVVDPGPDSRQIVSSSLDPDGWKVTLSAKGPKGDPVAFEGVIADLGSYNRSLTGIWKQGKRSSELRLVRE